MSKSDDKRQRRQSVAFKQYEDILKTITKSNTKSPLPVKDRRVGARMKKYRQCFLGKDLIKSLVDQNQVSSSDEAVHIATELLHSKLIFPTAKASDDSNVLLSFSKKQYYSISEDIAITATKNQRAMIKVRSQVRNLEEMILEMKESFSEVDTTRSADMVAINNYVKSQAKYNRTLLWVIAGMISSLTCPKMNIVNLDVMGLEKYTNQAIGEWIPWLGWCIMTIIVLLFVKWMTKHHKAELSILSRKLGVGAISKLASVSQRASMDKAQGSKKGEGANGAMKLALDVHQELVKQMAKADIDSSTGCLTNTSIAPLYTKFPGKLTDEADCWSESPGDAFKVRGPNYLQDGVKIKSRDCAFKLLHVEFFAVDEGVKVENIAGKKESFAGHVRKKAQEEGKEPPFLLVICFNFPGYAFACYFQRRVEKVKDSSFDHLFKKFVENGDDFRDERFKILPGIPPGGANFLVRKTVGNKPAICGRAVEQQWFNHKNYLEANMDVSGSYMATKILAVVKGFTKGLTIDLTFIIQGNDYTELPERILCGIRIHKPDLKGMPRWGIEGPKRSDGD